MSIWRKTQEEMFTSGAYANDVRRSPGGMKCPEEALDYCLLEIVLHYGFIFEILLKTGKFNWPKISFIKIIFVMFFFYFL